MASAGKIVSASVHNIEVSDRTVWRHVVLETEAGLTAVGEATHEPVDAGFTERFRALANQIVGRNTDGDCMLPLASLKNGNLPDRSVLSALNQALSDLQAQQKGISVRESLGGSSADISVPLYANINRVSRDRTPETFARNAAAAVKEGFAAVKIAAFDDLVPELCGSDKAAELIAKGLARLSAVVDAVPDADVMVDCHWRFDVASAKAIIPALKELGVCWFECPLPETEANIADLRAIRKLANSAGIRLCGLETFGDWSSIASFVEGGAYDVIMPDVKHAGSLQTILDLAENASRHDVNVSLHNPTGPIAHFFSEQVAAVLGGPERLEIQWQESPLFYELTDPRPVLKGGYCQPSSRAGLGASFLGIDADKNAIEVGS